MTALDQRLKDLAAADWDSFAKLIGEDAMTNAKICLLRGDSKSYGQIMLQLNVDKNRVRYRVDKCDCPKAEGESDSC